MGAVRGLQVAAGLLAVVVALVDVAWTTIAAGSGGGPVTVRLARQLWRAALRLHRRVSAQARGRVLVVAGVLIVFALLITWLLLVLVGWSLVFTAADGAVRDATTAAPAGVVDRLYFTGYTVFTLGNGELRPGAGTWQLATVAATGTGLILVTLSITYLVPVAAAVAQRRSLAGTIHALGGSPAEIVRRAWTGEGFAPLEQHLVTLVPLVQAVRQQHLTYPVLHYFHSVERRDAAAPNLVDLDDALLLLTERRPGRATGARRARPAADDDHQLPRHPARRRGHRRAGAASGTGAGAAARRGDPRRRRRDVAGGRGPRGAAPSGPARLPRRRRLGGRRRRALTPLR